MIILQKPQAYRTTQCLFCRIMLNINQEEKLQSNQPSYANFLPADWVVKGNFGAADHWGPPKRPLGQKNTCAKEREHVNAFGEIVIICMFTPERSMNMYVKHSV